MSTTKKAIPADQMLAAIGDARIAQAVALNLIEAADLTDAYAAHIAYLQAVENFDSFVASEDISPIAATSDEVARHYAASTTVELRDRHHAVRKASEALHLEQRMVNDRIDAAIAARPALLATALADTSAAVTAALAALQDAATTAASVAMLAGPVSRVLSFDALFSTLTRLESDVIDVQREHNANIQRLEALTLQAVSA